MSKSNLDLVNECDHFPYKNQDPEAHAAQLAGIYTLVWDDGKTIFPYGYMLESVFNAFAKVPIRIKGEIEVSRSKRTITAYQLPTEEERSKAVAATVNYWREKKAFKVLAGWRDELYPAYGPGNELLFNVERSASCLFGIVTYGIHLTAYTPSPESSYGMKIWVPRRATNKTYGGMLDNTVAGGMASGETPFESLVRESDEEASLPEGFVRANAKAKGTITYVYIREERAGGEIGMIQPECQYVYDIELPNTIVPKPNDSEVQEFYLWTIEEIQTHLAAGEFKPNCAMTMLDFFIRHGISTEENEKDYEEIKRRLHRELDFVGPWSG